MPRIIAEPLLKDNGKTGINDYKFFCFDGKVGLMYIATDRGQKDKEVKFDFFDRDFKHLDIKQGHDNASIPPKKPDSFDEMVEISEKLSKGIRHVRVDLYECNGHIFFGEMTFYHHCGLVPFVPENWDEKIGQMLRIGE